MIKFHIQSDEKEEKLTFGMVDEDQFFINEMGRLCQKISYYAYNTIAEADGTPYALHDDNVSPDIPIKKILPKVEKITWE